MYITAQHVWPGLAYDGLVIIATTKTRHDNFPCDQCC